jgi:TetR/AcrR family transcriptional regulator, transcriptional repressor for nem operon
LADIAQGARVPLGNVYYYFKTKDEIGEAVVQQRLTESRALRQECNRAGSPKERLQAYVEAILASPDEIVRGGCPTGTLCSELHKEGGPVAQKAIALLTEPLVWMEEQFKAAGQAAASRGLAVHLLAALQGVSVLAHGSQDPGLIVTETRRLSEWIRGL